MKTTIPKTTATLPDGRRKAFFFTLFFITFFFLFVLFAIDYARNVQDVERSISDARRLERVANVQEDLGADILSLMRIKRFAIERNNSWATISIDATFPSSYDNASLMYHNYTNYVERDYAGRVNLNNSLKINLTNFNATPYIYTYSPGIDVNYSYASVQRKAINISVLDANIGSGPDVAEYAIDFRPTSGANITIGSCGWAQRSGGAILFKFSGQNAANTSCANFVSNIDISDHSIFWANYSNSDGNGNYINISFFKLAGDPYYLSSLNITGSLAGGTILMPNMTIMVNVSVKNAHNLTAYAPVSLNFTNESIFLQSLILKQS